MKRHFRKNKVFLAPDIVMTLPLKNFFNRRKGVIISMRNDKEKFVTDFEFDIIVNFAKENFEKFSYYDSHIGRDNINFKEGEKELNLILNEYGKSKLVLTDRLHGMIFSYITGTPAIVFPNNNKKVEECYEWIKDSNTIRFLKDINDSNLKVLLTEISHSNFRIEQEKYDNKRKFFEALIIDSIDAS
jgi:pyruvyl transferase EpsI